MAEHQIVDLAVAGSNPASHPNLSIRFAALVRRQEGGLTGKQVRQFLGAVTRSEDRATRLQCHPGFEVPGIGGVESEGIDQLEHRSNRRVVIAGSRHGNASRRAVRAPALLELEVTEVVEALHHSRGREPLLYERASARRCSRKWPIDAIDLVPVVHRVDEDFAGEQAASKLWKAVHWYRQDDDAGVGHDLVGCESACAGSEHLNDQLYAVGGPGTR